MRRFVFAALLALPALALSQQEAKAWCKFNVGCSFNISYASGGKHFCCSSENPPCYDCPAPCGYGFGGYGYAAAPAPAAPYAAGYAPQQVVPAAWYGGSYGSAGYGYYPAYWYGR